ncbi:hypothetical protein E4V51_31410, partial [Paenibacillus sp. 28ISP30-2]|nr:hypothetical protein [Paenibacillus sp. 28ISP30-2]
TGLGVDGGSSDLTTGGTPGSGSTAGGGTSSGNSADLAGTVTGESGAGTTSGTTTAASGTATDGTGTDADAPTEYDLKQYPYRTLLTIWQRLELDDASTVTVDGKEYPLVQVKTAD